MPELRRDPIVGRWVIIATERARRPSEFAHVPVGSRSEGLCPFCPGHEDKTPPEVYSADRPHGGHANGPGWKVRVVPNKFPALQDRGGPRPAGRGHLRQDERRRGPRGDHRDPGPRPDARGPEPGRADRGAAGLQGPHPRPAQRPAPPLHHPLQEPRRRRRGLAGAHALAADRPAHRAHGRCSTSWRGPAGTTS